APASGVDGRRGGGGGDEVGLHGPDASGPAAAGPSRGGPATARGRGAGAVPTSAPAPRRFRVSALGGSKATLTSAARRAKPRAAQAVAVRTTPSATAASATYSATSGPTRVSNTDGMM